MNLGRIIRGTISGMTLAALAACSGDGPTPPSCTTCACTNSCPPPPATGRIQITSKTLSPTSPFAGDSATVDVATLADSGAVMDTVFVANANPAFAVGSSYHGKVLAALGSNSISITAVGRDSKSARLSKSDALAYTGQPKPVAPDSVSFSYLIKSPFGETLSNEPFTMTLPDNTKFTSANGVLSGRAQLTAGALTFSLTSPNSYDAKRIDTPASAITAATDTLSGVYDGKPTATIGFKPGTAAQGTIYSQLNNTAHMPNKENYDVYLHVMTCRSLTGRLNPNYSLSPSNPMDTTIFYVESVGAGDHENFNPNKNTTIYVVNNPVSTYFTNSYQVATSSQTAGLDKAVQNWDAIWGSLGRHVTLAHGETPMQALVNSSATREAPGSGSVGISNGFTGSVNSTYSSANFKQGGSSYLVVSNNAIVARSYDGAGATLSGMSEVGTGLVGVCGQGEDVYKRDKFHVDNPQSQPTQTNIDWYTVRQVITGPLIEKNERAYEATGTASWPRKILLGKPSSPWTVYETYTATDNKPALRPVYRP